MKNLIFNLFILSFFITNTNFGQFTVTSFFNPQPGDIQTMIYGDTSGILPGGGGPNQIWNFSNVTNSGDSLVQYFVLPSSTPFGGSFPTSTIACIINNQLYTYFSGTSSVFEELGYWIMSNTTIFTNPKKNKIYPFSYPGTFSDSFSAIGYQGSSIVKKASGNISVTYDGYGTLTLPSGTVTNVGRIKYVSYEIDTTIYEDITMVDFFKDTTWYWIKSNYRYELLIVAKNWRSTNGINYTGTKRVQYIPNINSVDVKLLSSGIPLNYKLEQNYPNPFNPITKIRYQIPENTKITIKVYDVFGREIETLLNGKQNAGFYEIEWDASKYASGFYFCRLNSNSFNTTMKMILIK